MGIFGISIYNVNSTLFERKYNAIMNDVQKKEAYLFFTSLSNKNDIFFKVYTECSSTYDTGIFMMWYQITLNTFLEEFG
jgi:hypothetical protein